MRTNHERIVGLLDSAFTDLDLVLDGLSENQLMGLPAEGSRFAWTYGHVASHVDGWINGRFCGRALDVVLGEAFAFGSSGLPSHSWPDIRASVHRVRETAMDYLWGLVPSGLDVSVPYDGSLVHLRESGLHITHAILRLAAHHYVHIGEIVTLRKDLGHAVAEPPGLLEATV